MLLAASPHLPATLSVFHLQINFKVFEFHAINSVLQAPQRTITCSFIPLHGWHFKVWFGSQLECWD